MDNNELLRQQKQIYIKHLIKVIKKQFKYNNLSNQYETLNDAHPTQRKISPYKGFMRGLICYGIQPVKLKEVLYLGHQLKLLDDNLYFKIKGTIDDDQIYFNNKQRDKINSQYKEELKALTKELHNLSSLQQLHNLISKYGIKECLKDITITRHRLNGISKTNKRIGGVPASKNKINIIRQIYTQHYNGDKLTPLLHKNHLTYAQYYYLSNKYIK